MLSVPLKQFIVRSASGGDIELEKFLGEVFPTLYPLAQVYAFSKPVLTLNLQMLLVDAALDKSTGLVDYFNSNRVMLSDSTTVSKIVGDGETDNFRTAIARMKDRENSWNRIEREGEEDTKNYHIAKSKSRLTEDTKHYDLSSNRSLSRGCSFEEMQSSGDGIGEGTDFASMARSSKSLTRTNNLDAAPFKDFGIAKFQDYFVSGNILDINIDYVVNLKPLKLLGVITAINIDIFNGKYTIAHSTLVIPPVDAIIDGNVNLPLPSCTSDEADDIPQTTLKCSNLVDSVGYGFRSAVKWNWEVNWSLSFFGFSLSSRMSGSADRIYSQHVKNEQVCSNATSSVVGLTFGHNDYAQTDSGVTNGTTKSTNESYTQHNSGNYGRGERVSYSRAKGEIKGLIEFCSQSDSASRRLRVAHGNITGTSKTWARTIADTKGQAKRIANTDTSSKYWSQMVKNLIALKKLLLTRTQEQMKLSLKMVGTDSEETLFKLCTFDVLKDVSNELRIHHNGLLQYTQLR